jgi:exopolyphosphatase/guanosine-5'-triphosphate,3'-diphosphate pyrophosphatase
LGDAGDLAGREHGVEGARGVEDPAVVRDGFGKRAARRRRRRRAKAADGGAKRAADAAAANPSAAEAQPPRERSAVPNPEARGKPGGALRGVRENIHGGGHPVPQAKARGRNGAADTAAPSRPEARRNGWPHPAARSGDSNLYAALDLGTNNCRLLIAQPQERGFRVVDAFSRIVRLGEGLVETDKLATAAMDRAVEALAICADKLRQHDVRRMRLVATEACRRAGNGAAFLDRVRAETGLRLEIVDRKTEARLAVAGCATLVDPTVDNVLLFDIGGGSSELVWLDLRERGSARGFALTRFMRAWTSLPVGVVTLSERHGGVAVTPEVFDTMVLEVSAMLDDFEEAGEIDRAFAAGSVHMLGTSGTVTTLAGVHLGLPRYDRRKVDGLWLDGADVDGMITRIRDMTYDERAANPCIGLDRADLVLAGCAILEAIRRRWRCDRLRVADRGLREGILVEQMTRDRVWRRRPNRLQPRTEA